MKDEKQEFAKWLVNNQDKQGTPDWDTVVSAFQKLDSQVEPSAEQTAPEPEKLGNDPSLGQVAAGLTAEVGIGVASQAAGAAAAPFTFGISYPVMAFAGGVLGSIAAQKIEERDSISPGRALFAGLVNLIPGSSAAKGVAKTGTVIAKGAGRGALTGAGEATAVAVVDEQRLPTFKEVATYTTIGGGFGGVLGGAMLGGRRLWNKIGRKTPEQLDEAVKSGEITPQEMLPVSESPDANAAIRSVEKAAEDVVMAVDDTPMIAVATATPSTLMGKFRNRLNLAKAALAPSRVLGKEIQSEAILSNQAVQAEEELGSRISRRVEKFVGKQTDPLDADAKINAYLDRAIEDLPPVYKDIQPELDLFREKMRDLQGKVIANIDTGRTPATPEIRDLIAKSMDEGNYLTREFKWFTDRDYFPTQKQLVAARKELGEDADEVLASLNSKKLSAVENRNFLPTAIDGFLRRKKDLGPAVLEYLGEIRQPGERIRGSLTRVARGVYRDEADDAIKQLLIDRKMATAVSAPGMNELFLRRYEKGGSGLYVPQYVQTALDQIYLSGGKDATRVPVISGLADLWNTGVGVSKAVKVLLNPPSYAVQLYGNMANLMGMGINPFNGAGRGLRIALSEYGPIERLTKNPEARVALLKEINDMTKYGIKGSNILDSDIRSSLERGIFSDAAQKTINPVSKAYTIPDTMGRYVSWKHHQRLFRDIFPSANEETIKKYAADVTNDVYQNYARLSRTGKELSRIGILPQFASFTMEFARNQWNQGRVIREMMAGKFGGNAKGLGPANLTAMKEEGGRRLSALLGVYGLTYASIKAWNANNNVDNKTEAALKDVAIPSFDQNRLLAITYDPKTQTGKYANPSYLVPNAVGLAALDAGLRGEPVQGVVDLLTNEFVGEGSFLARSVASAVFNTDPKNRKKITAEVDGYKKTVELIKFIVSDAFEPGFMREVSKFQQARRGQGDLSKADVARRQVGVRLNSFDVKESAMFRVKKNVENSRLMASRYSTARDFANKSPEEVSAIYDESNVTHKANMQEAIRRSQSLSELGFSIEEKVEILKDAGMGSSAILDTLRGVVSDLPLVKRVTPTNVWEETIAPLPPREQEKEIARIGRTDRQLATSLASILRSSRTAEARGVTGIDRLYLGLGVADGTRAEYIYRQMQESPNATGLLNNFKRKGIVTPQVADQIEKRLRAANAP
jgi:hypothetical protein